MKSNQSSKIHASFDARKLKPFIFNAQDTADVLPNLDKLGLHISTDFLEKSAQGLKLNQNELRIAAMDSGLQPTVTTGSIVIPVQFAQFFAPGFVQVMTAARKIDSIVGFKVMGNWEDEEVVQGIKEVTNKAVAYTDYGDIPLSGWNNNWERRTIQRFEQGFQVGALEESRSALIRINTAAEKRMAAGLALEIQRNLVGFFGFNNGDNRTFGLLNDPNLLAYGTLPTGASGHSNLYQCTFLEQAAIFRLAFQTLRTQSQDLVDPYQTPITIVLPTDQIDALATPNVQGTQTVKQWLNEIYPNARILSAPEFSGANGGADVMYVFADKLEDDSTDGGETFVQMVQTKFNALGVEKLAKGYKEDYSSATAGVMCKRPFLVTRWTFS